MRRILIFETNTGKGGHHIEYVHHLYMKALAMPYCKFVFVVSDKIKTLNSFKWPSADHILMDYVSESTVVEIKRKNILKQGILYSRLLRRYAQKHNISEIVLISLMNFMPFLPLFLPRDVKCSGIIYIIYLYLWHKTSVVKKIINVGLYMIMTHSSKFSKLFVLNDSSATNFFNKKYKTSKFTYLPDPVFVYEWKEIDIRKKYNIPKDAIFFLQCGILSPRKSTMEVLRAIEKINAEKLFFVFAGRVDDMIKKDFYRMVHKLSTKNIIVIDEFLTYDMMYSLIKSSDYVLALYRDTALSSGFIGHAANFNKPVIASGDGLIGKLVRKNNLGIIVDSLDTFNIARSIEHVSFRDRDYVNYYAANHTVEDFAQTILNFQNE